MYLCRTSFGHILYYYTEVKTGMLQTFYLKVKRQNYVYIQSHLYDIIALPEFILAYVSGYLKNTPCHTYAVALNKAGGSRPIRKTYHFMLKR